jgi:hypothetical protein
MKSERKPNMPNEQNEPYMPNMNTIKNPPMLITMHISREYATKDELICGFNLIPR